MLGIPTDPCANPSYGEAEDYNVAISGGIGAPCGGTVSFQLHANPTGGGSPYVYSWLPSTGLNATDVEDPIATPFTTTTYTVTISDACGGVTSGTVTVTVTPTPVVTVSPSSTTLCQGIPLTLTASGADSYTWSPAAGLSATTGSSVDATPSTTTTYIATGTTGGCSSTGSATVNIIPAPIINSTTAVPSNICIGGTSQLTTDAVDPVSGALPTGYCNPTMFGANSL